jgi:hypothetical protein
VVPEGEVHPPSTASDVFGNQATAELHCTQLVPDIYSPPTLLGSVVHNYTILNESAAISVYIYSGTSPIDEQRDPQRIRYVEFDDTIAYGGAAVPDVDTRNPAAAQGPRDPCVPDQVPIRDHEPIDDRFAGFTVCQEETSVDG